ncbi:MAG TPA: hypothetical protein PLQ93_12000 [Bacteroidia bacterium]|nr:hypothetical protein [Bacteroidia bacterium]
MESQSDLLSALLFRSKNISVESINDLRDKEFSGIRLSPEERFALSNFDRYRIEVLNAQEDKEKFHYKYRQLQVIANLGDWREFLNKDFRKV